MVLFQVKFSGSDLFEIVMVKGMFLNMEGLLAILRIKPFFGLGFSLNLITSKYRKHVFGLMRKLDKLLNKWNKRRMFA